jgi:uncharacterized protein (DUF2141 family)
MIAARALSCGLVFGLVVMGCSVTRSATHASNDGAPKPTTLVGAGSIDVHVKGIPSIEGRVVVMLYDERTYLKDDAFVAKTKAKVAASDMHVVLEHVPPGRYLVVVSHDANGNDTLDTSVVGMPTEAYGFSRDARGTFGPPDFDDAAFDFDGRGAAIAVELR